ncbi:MAG: hypothetical protein V8Q43_02815 [Christensenellaceae bacterium]
MRETVEYVAHSGVQGIKLQLLHVLRGTELATAYARGEVSVMEMADYIALVEDAIRLLPPEMVIHRLTGDGEKAKLLAPLWSADKKRVLNAMQRAFVRDDVRQGQWYREGLREAMDSKTAGERPLWRFCCKWIFERGENPWKRRRRGEGEAHSRGGSVGRTRFIAAMSPSFCAIVPIEMRVRAKLPRMA